MALPHRRIASHVAFAVILTAVTVLTGCGRNGALQPPPGASVNNSDNPDDGETAKKADSGKPQRAFFLDPLI